MRIYLDHAATAPVSAVARDAAWPWLSGGVASNPSSVHRSGQRARAAVDAARERVAHALGALPAEVVFTSGATEAIALAVHGTLDALPADAALVVGASEHAAVLAVAEREARRGRPVAYVPPAPHGVPDPARLQATLADLPGPIGLVAIMHTNNETGGVADVNALVDLAHQRGAAFLCDAVQALGYAPLALRDAGVDLAAVSAHKLGGLQGVGALIVRDGRTLVPQQRGGAQERGRRAGTHPVAAIAAFGAVAEAATHDLADRIARTAALRDRLEAALLRTPGVRRNGTGPRGPKHLNVRVDHVDGESLRLALDDAGIEVSAGSACAAGSVEPSHVLLQLGATPAQARASLRFSVGWNDGPGALDEAAIDDAARRFAEVVARLRSLPVGATGPLP
ncbi:MAG: cysteine desulfurase family protein [Trueperaceae bacterium]